MHVGVRGAGQRGAAGVSCVARATGAERFDAHHRHRVVQAAGDDRLGVIERGGAHGKTPHLRIGIGCRTHDRLDIGGAQRDEALERQPAHAGVTKPLRLRPVRVCASEAAQRLGNRRARLPHRALQTREGFEGLGEAEAIRAGRGARHEVEQRRFCTGHIGGGGVGQPGERFGGGRAHVGRVVGDEPRDERGLRRSERHRRCGVAAEPVCRLRDGVGGVGPHLRQAVAQAGKNVRDERRAFEPAERTQGDARRLAIAAAGTSTDDGQRRWARCPPVFRLQDGQPRCGRLRLRGRSGQAAEQHRRGE